MQAKNNIIACKNSILEVKELHYWSIPITLAAPQAKHIISLGEEVHNNE